MSFIPRESYAQGNVAAGDIYYRCINDTTYEVFVAMYWDCQEPQIPLEVTVNVTSQSCGEQIYLDMDGVPPDVITVPVCPNLLLSCYGGTVPGVKRLLFSDTLILPAYCNDWNLRFCYNTRVIADNIEPGEWMCIEANLDNTIGCNSSPSFSNPPVDYICAGDTYCFVQGQTEIDGDSLVYSLVDPLGYNSVPVIFDSIWTAQNPLPSTPNVFVDPETGLLCMNPDTQFTGVLALLIEEYRGGQLIGGTMRDMRFNILSCDNENPELSGVNGSNVFFDTTCAGTEVCMDIFSYDADSGQALTMTWNEGITLGDATFTISPDSHPVGNFCWTPEVQDTSSTPYCFDVLIRDGYCPYEGSRTQTYCIVVGGTTADATILPVDAFCPTDLPLLLPSVTQGGIWSGTGITNQNLGIFDANVAGVGAHEVIHRSFGDCNDSDTTTIYVDSAFDASLINYPDSMCLLDVPFPLVSNDLGGFWTSVGMPDSTSNLFDPSEAGVGLHEVIYRIGSACGDRDTISIEVLPVPDPTITTSDLAYCISESPFNFTSALSGGTWLGSGIINSSAGEFDPVTAGAGEHEIIYELSNQFCVNRDTITVTVVPAVNINLTQISPKCDNDQGFYLQATPLGGTWQGQGITNSLGYFNPPSAGVGTHEIIYTISGACSDADTIDIVVEEAPTVEIIDIPDTICQSAGNVVFEGSPAGGTWFGNGVVNGQTGEFDPSIGIPGPRNVQYRYNNGTCDATAFALILIIDSPSEPTVNEQDTLCQGDMVNNIQTNGIGQITWYNDMGLNNVITTGANLTILPTETDTFWVTASAGGCETAPIQVIVPFYPGPQVSLDDDPEVIYAGEEVLFMNTSLGVDYSYWDFGDGTTAASQLSGDQTHTYEEHGIYTITLIGENEHGCLDTMYLEIEVSPPTDVTIPSVFTPNGDNYNEEMVIEGYFLTDFKAQIFNRWGYKVYEWKDINEGWDGKSLSGQTLNSGTYYYIVTAVGQDGRKIEEKGFVELIR